MIPSLTKTSRKVSIATRMIIAAIVVMQKALRLILGISETLLIVAFSMALLLMLLISTKLNQVLESINVG